MWCSSFPIPSTSPTLPAAIHSIVSVTGKLQYRNPSQNGVEYSTRDTPLGHTSLTTLKTNPTLDHRRRTSSIKSSGSKEQQRSQEQSGLSGSDVLFALQRATTQKAKNKKKRRDPHSSPSNKSGGGSGSEGEEDDFDYRNVRPICVKPEWGSRLDELEKRLQELIDSAEA